MGGFSNDVLLKLEAISLRPMVGVCGATSSEGRIMAMMSDSPNDR